MDTMKILACRLRLLSRMSLEELGNVVSNRVLGGVPFVGRGDYIRDEVPAVYSEFDVLGTRFILMGEPDDEGYYLEADGRSLIANLSPAEIKKSLVDISSLVAHLLGGIEGVTVRTLRIQTVDTLANGAPTPRELSAASRIRAYRPGDRLLLVPKAEQGTSPLPLFHGGDEEGP
jgi:hypothetical protein